MTKEVKPRGHVIACRITSENPDEGFQPGSGTVQELNFRSSKNVWGYFSVAAFGSLHEFADSQFGHIFAWGETREQAMSYLGMALRELSIRGDFRTIVEYLTHLIETERFRSSDFSTGWLDQLIQERHAPKEPDTRISAISAALHIADRTWATQRLQYRQALERGQVLPLEALAQSVIQLSLVHKGRIIRLQVMRPGQSEFTITMNGSTINMEIVRLSDSGILVQLAGSSHCSYLQETLTHYRVTVNNQTAVFDKENDPSVLRAPSAGKLIGYIVDDGQMIKKGEVYAELEVMKMVMQVKVNHDGKIIHEKKPGSILTQGTCVARLELDDDLSQIKLEPFEGDLTGLIENKSESGSLPSSIESEEKMGHKRSGSFSERRKSGIGGRTGSFTQNTLGQLNLDQSLGQADQPHNMLKKSLSRIDSVLHGYTLSPDQMKPRIVNALNTLFLSLRNRALPLLEVKEAMTRLSGRLHGDLERGINKELMIYQQRMRSMLARFPHQKIQRLLDVTAGGLSAQEREMFYINSAPLYDLCRKYSEDIRGLKKQLVKKFFQQFVEVEKCFQQRTFERNVFHLLQQRPIDDTLEACFSHRNLQAKTLLITSLLEHVQKRDADMVADLESELQQMAQLKSRVSYILRF